MPKTSKKRSHKQGTGNQRARTRADQEVTTSNFVLPRLVKSTSPAQSRNLGR